jgi:hypothetical protein
MWYGSLLEWWVGGQEGGSVVLCAWCEGRCLTNVCPKHVELILKINKHCYLLHLVGFDFISFKFKSLCKMLEVALLSGL